MGHHLSHIANCWSVKKKRAQTSFQLRGLSACFAKLNKKNNWCTFLVVLQISGGAAYCNFYLFTICLCKALKNVCLLSVLFFCCCVMLQLFCSDYLRGINVTEGCCGHEVRQEAFYVDCVVIYRTRLCYLLISWLWVIVTLR